MKLFLTIFSAIIASVVTVDLVAAIILFGTQQVFILLGSALVVFAILLSIDIALKRQGA